MSKAEPKPTPQRFVLASLVRGLLVAVGLSPFFVAVAIEWPVLGWLAHGVDSWFAFHCHREAERSLAWMGLSAPVCARCLGIYVGLAAGALILRPVLGVWQLRAWVGLAALVMILDVLTESLDMRPAWAPLRLITGVALAYPVAVSVVRSLGQAKEEPDISRSSLEATTTDRRRSR